MNRTVVIAVVGLAAVGLGVYLLMRKPAVASAPKAAPTPAYERKRDYNLAQFAGSGGMVV